MCSKIKFTIKHHHYVNVKIFDSNDNFITQIIKGKLDTGDYNIIWNEKNSMGQNVSKGIYYYQMDSGENSKYISPLYVR